MSGVTLDAGALIALDRNGRKILVLLARAKALGKRVTVPATALAQAIRRPATQARLARLLRQPTTDDRSLDAVDATSVGIVVYEPTAVAPGRALNSRDKCASAGEVRQPAAGQPQ